MKKLPIVDRDSSLSNKHAANAQNVEEDVLIRVGELARTCGKTVRAIHHYEELGLLTPHKRSKGRYRLYGPDAITRVEWIGKLSALGLTLVQIQKALEDWKGSSNGPEAMASIRALYLTKLQDVRGQIDRLKTLERELQGSLAYLETCNGCSAEELVHSCSSCTNHDDHDEPDLIAGLHTISTASN